LGFRRGRQAADQAGSSDGRTRGRRYLVDLASGRVSRVQAFIVDPFLVTDAQDEDCCVVVIYFIDQPPMSSNP